MAWIAPCEMAELVSPRLPLGLSWRYVLASAQGPFFNSFKDHLRHTEGGYGSSSLVGLGCWLHDSISLRRFQEEAQDVLQAVARRS